MAGRTLFSAHPSGRGVLYHVESVDACLRLIAEKKVDLSVAAW